MDVIRVLVEINAPSLTCLSPIFPENGARIVALEIWTFNKSNLAFTSARVADLQKPSMSLYWGDCFVPRNDVAVGTFLHV